MVTGLRQIVTCLDRSAGTLVLDGDRIRHACQRGVVSNRIDRANGRRGQAKNRSGSAVVAALMREWLERQGSEYFLRVKTGRATTWIAITNCIGPICEPLRVKVKGLGTFRVSSSLSRMALELLMPST